MVAIYQQPARLETVADSEEHLRIFLLQSPFLLSLVAGQGVEGQGGHNHIERSTWKFFTRKVELKVESRNTKLLNNWLFADLSIVFGFHCKVGVHCL